MSLDSSPNSNRKGKVSMSELVVILAWLAVVVSIWITVYVVVRIIVRKNVMYGTWDMPSEAELKQMYENFNLINQYRVKE